MDYVVTLFSSALKPKKIPQDLNIPQDVNLTEKIPQDLNPTVKLIRLSPPINTTQEIRPFQTRLKDLFEESN